MTTPTTGEVSHSSKKPIGAEIVGFRGRLIGAGHPDYDIARAVWNGAIDRRPRLIARCVGPTDVVAAVRFARDHDLNIAIRGGGHNVAGTAVCDDGIVIDLSAMRAVRVDAASRRACRIWAIVRTAQTCWRTTVFSADHGSCRPGLRLTG